MISRIEKDVGHNADPVIAPCEQDSIQGFRVGSSVPWN